MQIKKLDLSKFTGNFPDELDNFDYTVGRGARPPNAMPRRPPVSHAPGQASASVADYEQAGEALHGGGFREAGEEEVEGDDLGPPGRPSWGKD